MPGGRGKTRNPPKRKTTGYGKKRAPAKKGKK